MKINPVQLDTFAFMDLNDGDVFCFVNEWPVKNIYMKCSLPTSPGMFHVHLGSGVITQMKEVTVPVHVFFGACVDLGADPNEGYPVHPHED